MTSPSRPRKSVDSLVSISSTPSLTQYESPRAPPTQRFPSRRSSTASSITSIGGVLDSSTPHHGSIAESGQNAISSLLQPPIVRTGLLPHTAVSSGGYKSPSTRDIPPVTLSNIVSVDSKDFQPYLAQVGSLYDAFQQAKEGGEDGEAQLSRKDKGRGKTDDLDSTLLGGRRERRLSGVSTSSRATSPLDTRQRRRSSGSRGRGTQTAPLSTIPNIYFDENFHLENPRTFDVVSERSDIIKQPPRSPGIGDNGPNGSISELPTMGRKALATNAILQEKLSWYMDTVEIHLISSISSASKSFFTALGSLRELHSEAAESVKKIRTLRKDLTKLDKEMALGGLKVVNLRRRRENVRRLGDAVAQLQDIVDSVSECEDMVNRGDIEEAMDGLDEVERLMAGEQPARSRGVVDSSTEPPREYVDLRGIKALEGASDDLGYLRHRIGVGYEGKFLDGLLGDLRRHVESVPSDVTLQRWGASFQRSRGSYRSAPPNFSTYMNLDDQLRVRLRIELAGLGRARHTMAATTAFKTAVLREMKSLIRSHLPSSSDDDNESMMSASTHGGRQLSQQEKSSFLARNLRSLDPEDAQTMFTKIYTGISESLRRLSVQVKVLLDITSGLSSPSIGSVKSPRSPNPQSLDTAMGSDRNNYFNAADIAQEELMQVLDMSSILGQAVDIVQSQVTKVLRVRSEQTSQLPLVEFLRYFTLNRLFADECEAISGRSGTSLKTVVDNQIRDYIAQFGDSQRHRIVQIMDSDKWDAKDFGDAENGRLQRILEASTRDVEMWTETAFIWLSPKRDPGQDSAQNGTVANGNGNGKDKVRSAVVDDQKYILVESALAILKSIEEFEHLMTGIPSMMQDISSHLLECLKLFNSRSSQLILGAGATRSAGLKNITTKHLALATQALSFITAIIPYVREFVRRRSSSGPAMAEFDKVKRLLQEHQNGIHEKLVDIMGSRASVHAGAMKKIDWDSEKDTSAVSAYMETLVKETGTLQRVLAKHLPEMSVLMIMNPVFDSYREQWSRAFKDATVKTERGRQRMLSDVEFFKSKISKIDGSGDIGVYLVGVVQAKAITADPPSSSAGSSPNPEVSGSSQGEEKAETGN